MINRPPEDQLLNQGSKYSLVVAVARRARQIVARRVTGVVLPHKPVTIALDEIARGAVRVVVKSEQEPEAEAIAPPETEEAPPVPEEIVEKAPQ